jgi:hypothetical protein
MNHVINGHKFVTLLYDEEINRFLDGMGNVVDDIFRLITPSQVMVFKKYKEMCVVGGVDESVKVTLIYLNKGRLDLK